MTVNRTCRPAPRSLSLSIFIHRGSIDDLTKPLGTLDLTYTTSGSVKDENDNEVGFVIMDDPTLSSIL